MNEIKLWISIGVLLTLTILLLVSVLKNKKRLKRFQGLISIEDEVKKQSGILNNLGEAKSKINEVLTNLNYTKDQLHKDILIYEDKTSMIEVASYDNVYDFYDSEEFKDAVNKNKEMQKSLIKRKRACKILVEWSVEGSKAKGKKMSSEAVKLTLRSFNNECDALIGKVKWNNVGAFNLRIKKAFEIANKLNSSNKIVLTNSYLVLKYEELTLNYEKQLKIQEEKDRAKEIADQIREEEKAVKEHEKAIIDAERKENDFAKALKLAKQQAAQETGSKLSNLNARINRLQAELKAARSNKERAVSQAQLTRSGYVYVLSNLGSFGENTYKIGMTRRLNPNDRVKELSGAAVPFVFDTHAMIFSEDAPKLENTLHKHFSSRRVNKVNNRKEFFNVELSEIKKAVKSFGLDAEFIMNHEAEQFRLS